MKKFIYLFMVLGLVFTTSCDPLDDINAEIDSKENPVVGDAVYTLTAADYSSLKLTSGNFSSEDDVKTKIPGFLSSKYPVWGKGSGVLLNYKLYVGTAPEVAAYTLAPSYELLKADYAPSGSTVQGFYPTVNANDFLPAVLASNIAAPVEGQNILAKYVHYTEVPTVINNYYSLAEDFNYGTTAGDFTTITSEWTAHANIGTGLIGYSTSSLTMTNYPNSAVGGSIILPSGGAEDINKTFSPITSGTVYSSALVNFSSAGAGTYFFHFMDDAFGYSARVGAKDNGAGKILFGIGATSSTLSYGTTPFDLNTTYLVVASYNIDSGKSNLYVLSSVLTSEPSTPEATSTGNAGAGIRKVGIRQASGGPLGTIDGVRVASSWKSVMSNELSTIVTGAKTNKEDFYTYTSGNWKLSTGAYLLTANDYDSMGEASGQPGRYNNFDNTMAIDTYISKFLSIKYPYAKNGDKQIIIYKYYSSTSGSTQTRGNLYTVVNGVWTGSLSVIDSSLQFGHDGVTWVPDNTIKYTLVRDDYTFIGNALLSVEGYATAAASAKNYGNFDRRVGNAAEWTNTMLEKAMDILLKQKNPSAAVGQKYTLTFAIYNGSAGTESLKVIKGASGNWILNQ